ncbi:hypothetical protein PHYPSEUDO_010870 [Phytophthora pseudosyringae]|uniref:Uncharacterized protein n=1 Tax=Phytophthora pseudosyringae TaxID=221518 RepID=A0A8T1VCQ8_9STRA|nr:hypothetical protein PHYPSEUDO_010870 [Phytophthora pseudosyringae]
MFTRDCRGNRASTYVPLLIPKESVTIPTKLLPSGARISIIGFGTYLDHDVTNWYFIVPDYATVTLLSSTTTKRKLAEAIRDSGIPREVIFVTSQLWLELQTGSGQHINEDTSTCSCAQALVAISLTRDIVPLPTSANTKRQKENLDAINVNGQLERLVALHDYFDPDWGTNPDEKV